MRVNVKGVFTEDHPFLFSTCFAVVFYGVDLLKLFGGLRQKIFYV